MTDIVAVILYDPAWPDIFERLRDNIADALGNLAVTIEHVGSTSVVGLAAKPIIDIDVVVPSRDEIPAAIAGLATIGYIHQGDLGIAGREAFQTPQGTPAHHLYLCSQDSVELRRHIVFRDYLRRHPDEVVAYGAIKLTLADSVADRAAYMDGKDATVKEILARALDEVARGS